VKKEEMERILLSRPVHYKFNDKLRDKRWEEKRKKDIETTSKQYSNLPSTISPAILLQLILLGLLLLGVFVVISVVLVVSEGGAKERASSLMLAGWREIQFFHVLLLLQSSFLIMEKLCWKILL
jgi:hypothetical protein